MLLLRLMQLRQLLPRLQGAGTVEEVTAAMCSVEGMHHYELLCVQHMQLCQAWYVQPPARLHQVTEQTWCKDTRQATLYVQEP